VKPRYTFQVLHWGETVHAQKGVVSPPSEGSEEGNLLAERGKKKKGSCDFPPKDKIILNRGRGKKKKKISCKSRKWYISHNRTESKTA